MKNVHNDDHLNRLQNHFTRDKKQEYGNFSRPDFCLNSGIGVKSMTQEEAHSAINVKEDGGHN
jgi:hypothetical protein